MTLKPIDAGALPVDAINTACGLGLEPGSVLFRSVRSSMRETATRVISTSAFHT